MTNANDDRRLIEAGFPCHQVGAETQRERGASSALPPLYYLHVWWARRPLTPSRAAVLGSILPAEADPDWFLKELGIFQVGVLVNNVFFFLEESFHTNIFYDDLANIEAIEVTEYLLRSIQRQIESRKEQFELIESLLCEDPDLKKSEEILQWWESVQPFNGVFPMLGERLAVCRRSADPAWFKRLMSLASSKGVRVPNLYGYSRAYQHHPNLIKQKTLMLDLTSGGGSIPFEGLRLGLDVVANELNPVASTILHATLQYPVTYGKVLLEEIAKWGRCMLSLFEEKVEAFFPRVFPLNREEAFLLREVVGDRDALFERYNEEETMTYLYARQVICPHCGGEAPLLNTCWLSKGDGDPWGAAVIPDGKKRNGTVSFRTYRVKKGKGPFGEDPDRSTVSGGKGTCVHCGQGIEAEEIKRQARGESEHGRWRDRLYAVAAVRFQPKLDREGRVQYFKSGERAGEIKTEKIRFFRPPNEQDLAALDAAEKMLAENWDRWEDMRLIPTENIPEGHKTREPLRVGFSRWCDLFTPRQLLGHLFLVEELNRLKPEILQKLGPEKGKAVVTYLQFAIDKGVDYNSRQTRWEYTRGIVKGTFGRHDFSLKWTFGEMIFCGPNSGAAWGLSQILDAYKGMAELLEPVRKATGGNPPLTLLYGTAASIPSVADRSVDVICFDPPYYNNVQYAELSDYFYVWQKRTLGDLYPDLFVRRLTNKADEAVANPDRDGGEREAKAAYERMMGEIFAEARRVLKDDGILTMMFTHKSQDAWETLTQALIEKGWLITSTVPVESETEQGFHTKGNASAISSIFISCRKGPEGEDRLPSSWTGFGGSGVQHAVRSAVERGLRDFVHLKLNPVDEMVSCYGRALQVLSSRWPVLDGDEPVGPRRAMLEASRVVAEAQMQRIAGGGSLLSELAPEAAMAALLFAVFGLNKFSFDEGLNLSRSLNISLESKTGGYLANGRFIGVNTLRSARAAGARAEDEGFDAPLLRSGSMLRLALPEERAARRMEAPQTEWDLLHGLLRAFREGGEVAARGFAERHAREKRSSLLALLRIWAAQVAEDGLKKEAEALLFAFVER